MFRKPVKLPGIGTLRSWSDVIEHGLALGAAALCCSWLFYFAWVCLVWLAQNFEPITAVFTLFDAVIELPNFPYLVLKIALLPVVAVLGLCWGGLPFFLAIFSYRTLSRYRSLKRNL